MIGVPMIPMKFGISVHPISLCKNGGWTVLEFMRAPVTASTVRIIFIDEARKSNCFPVLAGVKVNGFA
jgi:hypothetical protein